MTQLELFTAVLNLQPSWFAKEASFAQDGKPALPELRIAIDFEKGSAFECPEEGRGEECKVHDTQERTWRHLNFFRYRTFIDAKAPGVKCERRGVKTANVPWASPISGFTLLFEAFALESSKSMPVSEAARIMNESDTKLWRMIRRYAEAARNGKDESGVKHMGTDETSVRGRNCIAVLTDARKKEAICIAKGEDSAAASGLASDFSAHEGRRDGTSLATCVMSSGFGKRH